MIALWGTTAVPKRGEIVAGLRIHGSVGGRDLGRRRLFGGVELIIARCQKHELLHLFGVLRRVAAGTRPAERPGHKADLRNVPQRQQVVDHGPDVVPIGRDGGHLLAVGRRARFGMAGRERKLLRRVHGAD